MVDDVSDVDALSRDNGRVYRVEKRGMGWALEDESSLFGGPLGKYGKKSQAVKAGRKRRDSEDTLIIERADGTVQERVG